MGPAICMAHLLAADKEQKKNPEDKVDLPCFSIQPFRPQFPQKKEETFFFLIDVNLLTPECCMQKRPVLELKLYTAPILVSPISGFHSQHEVGLPGPNWIFICSLCKSYRNHKTTPPKKPPNKQTREPINLSTQGISRSSGVDVQHYPVLQGMN